MRAVRQPQSRLRVERRAGGHAIVRARLPRSGRAVARRRRQQGGPHRAGVAAARRLLPLGADRPAAVDAGDRARRVFGRRDAARQARAARAARRRATASTTTPAGSRATSDMAGDYYGYDGPCPPWNDEIAASLRVHAVRARRAAGSRSTVRSRAPTAARAMHRTCAGAGGGHRCLYAEPRRLQRIALAAGTRPSPPACHSRNAIHVGRFVDHLGRVSRRCRGRRRNRRACSTGRRRCRPTRRAIACSRAAILPGSQGSHTRIVVAGGDQRRRVDDAVVDAFAYALIASSAANPSDVSTLPNSSMFAGPVAVELAAQRVVDAHLARRPRGTGPGASTIALTTVMPPALPPESRGVRATPSVRAPGIRRRRSGRATYSACVAFWPPRCQSLAKLAAAADVRDRDTRRRVRATR